MGVIMHTCNPSTGEAEAGGLLQLQVRPTWQDHSKIEYFYFLKKNTKSADVGRGLLSHC